ncbi:tetratricopeptide repeat protein [Nostoc muscorum FACHB-395]|nr:tetratricopeptide repeat protein [Desmonostoc muscorum FACHB-395]
MSSQSPVTPIKIVLMETQLGRLEQAITYYETALKELKKLIENKLASHSSLHTGIVQHLFNLWFFYQGRQEHTNQSHPKTIPSDQTTELETLKDCILIVLIARGNLQTLLMSDGSTSLQTIKQISQLDGELEQLGELIAQYGDLERWRKLLKPQPQFWWWFFHTPTHLQDQFDWIWNGLSLLLFTISLGLFTNLVPRFFVGGTDWMGTIAVAIQSVISLIGIQGSLTTMWQGKIEERLESMGLAKHWQQEVRCGIAVGILATLSFSYAMLPSLSKNYNQAGTDALKLRQGQDDNHQFKVTYLATAESNFNRAIALDPDNADAHYNLGQLYESIQSLDKARPQYLLAAQNGVTHAYNNLGRLEILDKKYASAVSILSQGIKVGDNDKGVDKNVEYNLHKNLGWARLKQERYQEAQDVLQQALKINPTRAAAHCLIAQTLEAQNQKRKARDMWKICLESTEGELKVYKRDLREVHFPSDEDQWKDQAQKCLKPDFLKKPCLEKKESLSEDKK